ncbi:MAG TPA: bifunctional UDP-N-acetylglucosamine diphosphorylase/glucosamine-1-phosphate N-acetyltransferase GlmU [Methyloceanibacter sp.]
MTQSSPSLAIVLAAGKGTRMKSALPKVLHRIAGAPMIAHVLRAAQAAGIGKTSLVVGPGMEDVARAATALEPKLQVFVQAEQLGTADAVKAARQAFEDFTGNVLILYGDTPLLRAETLDAVRAELDGGADLVVIGFEAENPIGYGRLLLDDRGRLAAIREEKDASDAERALTLCNSGIMGFRSGKTLLGLLGRIGKNNAKGEFYLTDAVALTAGDRLETRIVTSNGEEVLGVNSRGELAQAEGAMQRRLRARIMADGATLIAPDTVFLSYDTKIGKDVRIEPHVVIGERVAIADGVTIRAFSHLEGARIGEDATVGPFARLRPGAELGRNAHIGNFVEIKQSEIGEGAKINHLTYIGDTSVGARVNVGAGTIVCNYDGFAKHRTEIGAGAFIGSNSSLVAPVKIGEGAYIGSGSVISKDVEADALALTRAPQEERKGWAARVRERRGRAKAKGGGNKGT